MHYNLLIIGAGTGGIMVAAQMKKANPGLTIAIVDASETHIYQPAYTLVGAGAFDMKKTRRPNKDYIPSGVKWIKEMAHEIHPEKNTLVTNANNHFTYDYLVVSPGVLNDLDAIPGLREALDKKVACSNYTDPEETWHQVQHVQSGRAIYTMPGTPIKCGGAPQKAAYLGADHFRRHGKLKNIEVHYITPGGVIFGVPEIRETLEKVIKDYGIHFKTKCAPVRIDALNKTITFKLNGTDEEWNAIKESEPTAQFNDAAKEFTLAFSFLHIVPPQKTPDFIRLNTELANEGGFLDVDIHTLQHKKFNNIFGIGDAAALPTAKTGAAIRKQAPIVLEHINAMIKSNSISEERYNGYSSCPLVTGYGRMVLAEFDYNNKFTPDPKLKNLFITDSAKQLWRLWILKKHILPHLYWNKMMKGEKV